MSLLSSIGRGIGELAQAAVKPLAAATPFMPALAPLTAVTGIISKIAPTTSPVKVPTPSVPVSVPSLSFSQPYSAPPTMAASSGGGGIIGTAIGGAIGALAPQIGSGIINTLTGGATGAAGGCGCNGSKGRDPCTHQRIGSKNHPAPLATFFGGCCPPGRVLRRKPMGRDICIKQPRMNVFNPRALARADMRITGFVRRAAPVLADMGFHVERKRHLKKVRTTGRRRARR